MHIQISLGTNFTLNWLFEIFGSNYNKKFIFELKKKKKITKILHIQINLDSEFQLQQTVLIFGTHFQKKVYFWSKTEKKLTSLLNSSYSN